MAGEGRIVVISDTHLCSRARGAVSAEALRPLWQGAAELIINGDAAEIADDRERGPAARQVLALQTLTEADGVKLTLISGNHEPLITDRRYLRLAHREVFLTHGDILHPAISPWTDHARHLRQLHADAVMSLNPDNARSLDAQLAACQQASAVQWDHFVTRAAEHPGPRSRLGRHYAKLRKLAKAGYYWHTIPRRAMGFARRFAPESRFFIFGHIHRAGVWVDRQPGPNCPGDERFIINTGAYQTPRCPRAVVIEGRRLEVWPVRYDPAGHRFASKPIQTYELLHAAVAARLEGVDEADTAAA